MDDVYNQDKSEAEAVSDLSKGMDDIFNVKETVDEVQVEDKTEDKTDEVNDEVLNELVGNNVDLEDIEKELIADERTSEQTSEQDTDGEKPEGESDTEVEDSDDSEVSDGSSDGSSDSSDDKEFIPQDQVDIARRVGYSDEEIIKMAENKPERLERLVEIYRPIADLSQREVQRIEPASLVEKPESKPVPKVEHFKFDGTEDVDADTVKLLSKFEEAHNTLVDKFNTQSEELVGIGERASEVEKQKQTDDYARIDGIFDGFAEEIPEVGNLSSGQPLTKEQTNSRLELFGMANILQQTRGITEAAALDEVKRSWVMSHTDLETLKKEAVETVKEKLLKSKKRMSPRPGGQKTAKKFKSYDEAALEYLTQGMEEALG